MKAFVLLLALSGCASFPEGLELSEADRQTCKANGCTAWTVDELKGILRKAFEAGYERGVKSI